MSDVILKQILDELKGLNQGQAETNQRLEKVEQKLEGFERKLEGFERKLEGFEKKLEGFEQKLEGFEQRLGLLEAELKAFKESVEAELTALRERVILMENEHSKKFDALFDAYSLIYDVSREIRTEIVKLKVEQEHQDLRIKWIDSTIKRTG